LPLFALIVPLLMMLPAKVDNLADPPEEP
jgi:hypothetical protein